MPNDFGFLEAERADQCVHADGGMRHIQTVGGDGGIADAGKIGCNHSESLRQQWDERFPHE